MKLEKAIEIVDELVKWRAASFEPDQVDAIKLVEEAALLVVRSRSLPHGNIKLLLPGETED